MILLKNSFSKIMVKKYHLKKNNLMNLNKKILKIKNTKNLTLIQMHNNTIKKSDLNKLFKINNKITLKMYKNIQAKKIYLYITKIFNNKK